MIETPAGDTRSAKPASSNLANLETIKFALIQNRDWLSKAGQTEGPSALSSKEAIRYLVRALEFADAAFASDIETALFRVGSKAIPVLVKGLVSKNNMVRSSCAMVLIRLGSASIEPVQQFYARQAHHPQLEWIGRFLLDELGAPLPEVAVASKPSLLEKVG